MPDIHAYFNTFEASTERRARNRVFPRQICEFRWQICAFLYGTDLSVQLVHVPDSQQILFGPSERGAAEKLYRIFTSRITLVTCLPRAHHKTLAWDRAATQIRSCSCLHGRWAVSIWILLHNLTLSQSISIHARNFVQERERRSVSGSFYSFKSRNIADMFFCCGRVSLAYLRNASWWVEKLSWIRILAWLRWLATALMPISSLSSPAEWILPIHSSNLMSWFNNWFYVPPSAAITYDSCTHTHTDQND